jgi:methyl-accepting chemotaxis protein
VIDSWESLRRVKNCDAAGLSEARAWSEIAGCLLFQRFFAKQPAAKTLFGFPANADPKELVASKRFIMHGTYLIQMIDTAINMLGPDIELLTEIMRDLGVKHVRYGVKPEYFPDMGDALIATLEEILGMDVITDSVKASWGDTYKALSAEMIASMTKENRRKSGQ